MFWRRENLKEGFPWSESLNPGRGRDAREYWFPEQEEKLTVRHSSVLRGLRERQRQKDTERERERKKTKTETEKQEIRDKDRDTETDTEGQRNRERQR